MLLENSLRLIFYIINWIFIFIKVSSGALRAGRSLLPLAFTEANNMHCCLCTIIQFSFRHCSPQY